MRTPKLIANALVFGAVFMALGCAPVGTYQGGGYYYGMGIAPGTTGAAYLPGAGVAPEYATAPETLSAPEPMPASVARVVTPRGGPPLVASQSVADVEMTDAEALFVQTASPITRLREPMVHASQTPLHALSGAQLALHIH